MITCNLFGHLGNQLFQIAATIGYAEKYNLPYHIPFKTTHDKFVPVIEHLQNKLYDLQLEKISINQPPNPTAYTELTKPSLLQNNVNICLNGYFQSYKYFEHCEDAVRNAILPSSMPTLPNNHLDWVSLHVRRGDYVHLQQYHPLVHFDWYIQTILFFKEKGFHRFLIFSDDMDWAEDHFNEFRFNGSRFVYSKEQDPFKDMLLMAQCSHHIIANSTFSWWGAWLNTNKNKIVVYPEHWFGPAYKDWNTKDLCPPNWIKM